MAGNAQKTWGSGFVGTPGGFVCFGDHRLAKKETAFRLSLWWARRNLNVSHQVRDKIHVVGRNGSPLSPSRHSADGFAR